MTFYVIKTHYTPTEKNPNFWKESEHDSFTGKGTQSMTDYPDGWLHLETARLNDSLWMIQNYAFKTIAGARKGLKVMEDICRSESSRGMWKATAEIMAVEI